MTLPDVTRHSDNARESIRAINHITLGRTLPAPFIYEVLGNLRGMVDALPQAFNQLSLTLAKSLDEFEVFEDDGGDPSARTKEATDHLVLAAHLADQLGNELAAAQTAIARQGYRNRAN